MQVRLLESRSNPYLETAITEGLIVSCTWWERDPLMGLELTEILRVWFRFHLSFVCNICKLWPQQPTDIKTLMLILDWSSYLPFFII